MGMRMYPCFGRLDGHADRSIQMVLGGLCQKTKVVFLDRKVLSPTTRDKIGLSRAQAVSFLAFSPSRDELSFNRSASTFQMTFIAVPFALVRRRLRTRGLANVNCDCNLLNVSGSGIQSEGKVDGRYTACHSFSWNGLIVMPLGVERIRVLPSKAGA